MCAVWCRRTINACKYGYDVYTCNYGFTKTETNQKIITSEPYGLGSIFKVY